MNFQEYLSLNIKEETLKTVPPKLLHTFQATKVNCDVFSGISIHSCPGKTEICSSRCYDAKSIKTLVGGIPNMRKSLWYTYWAMYEPDKLQEQLLKEIPICTPVIRVHVGGDFVSPEHVKVWQFVANANKKNRFFAFTRSWQIPEINQELLILKEISNFTVFASVDAQTGLPPEEYSWRIAQMTEFYPNIPRTIACPEMTKKVGSCQQCKLCFGDKRVKTNLVFHLHGQGRKPNERIIINENNLLIEK